MRAMHDLPVLDLYDVIEDTGTNNETHIATVIRGKDLGEKALLTGGKIIWTSAAEGFFEAHKKELTGTEDNGIFTIDGQDVYKELLGGEKQAVICGAGHVSMPIITITKMMGMNVTVIDDRAEFIENARKRGADRVICKSFAEGMAEIKGSDDTFFIIVTRGHRYDKDCVAGALLKKHAYVGMIGSKRHAAFVRQSLHEEGIPDDLIDTIYTPIGLDIAAETPEEIAVAVCAEIIEVKNRKKRSFGFSKEMLHAITDRDREPMILATIVSRKGSAPRSAGAKMLVRKDGSIIDTIGGGTAEAAIMKAAAELLKAGKLVTELRQVGLAHSAEEDGEVCGGVIEVLIETV